MNKFHITISSKKIGEIIKLQQFLDNQVVTTGSTIRIDNDFEDSNEYYDYCAEDINKSFDEFFNK